MDDTLNFDKFGAFKKVVKNFVKGMVRSKLAVDADGKLTIAITKDYDKASKVGHVALTIVNEASFVKAVLEAKVSTRIYNKVDPTLFEQLKDQLANAKNPITIVVE